MNRNNSNNDIQALQIFRAYSNIMEVSMCATKPIKNQYHFPKPDQDQIKELIFKKSSAPIEKLLKFINKKFQDKQLQKTIVHKLFYSQDYEIQKYVPELVYIAIKRMSSPMKKLLIYKASKNQALRRLILWNVKAFTVIMKEQDANLKNEVLQFENKLTQTVASQTKFSFSEKAIAMLTQASLILKTMPPQKMKDKLKKFIKRYNSQILNNINHQIIIPFQSSEKTQSNYVVQLVEEDCSCFPTRKRVPYRIIIQTVSQQELKDLAFPEKLIKQKKVEPDEQRDLFNEVQESVQKMYSQQHFIPDTKYPFVVDKTEKVRYSEMKNYLTNFVLKVEEQQRKKQKDVRSSVNNIKSNHSINSATDRIRRLDSLQKYQITQTKNLKLFDTIFIPDISDGVRKSVEHNQQNYESYLSNSLEKSRKSDMNNQNQRKNVRIYKQQINEWNATSETLFGQPWIFKHMKYRTSSVFSKLKSLRHRNVVVKGGDDLRQQIVCMQLISKIKDILDKVGLDIFIKPYQIIVLSQNSGILEFVSNSISIDQMKKKSQKSNINKFFRDIFTTTDKLKKAKQNFISSLAGSSILTYILKLKDRHNGNILLDMDGNIIHIDFGFILGMNVGNFNFETSPFKFTEQYLEVLEGKQSAFYQKFCKLFCSGMIAIRHNLDEFVLILEIMMVESDLECFKDFNLEDYKAIFQLHLDDVNFEKYCIKLIERSCLNSRTNYYDTFQQFSNGIMP